MKTTFFYQQPMGVEWGSHSTAVLWACGVTGPINSASGMIVNLAELQKLMKKQGVLQRGTSLNSVLERLHQEVTQELTSKFSELQIECRFEFRVGGLDCVMSSKNYVQISGVHRLESFMVVVEQMPTAQIEMKPEEDLISVFRAYGLRELWTSSWGSDISLRLI
ncbi:MAG: hypothetical protein ACK5P6_03230 [Pseudobdellovibrionaceae bacterium]